MKTSRIGLASLALLALISTSGQAGVQLTMIESGGDVIISGGGTLSLTGLTFSTNVTVGGAAINPQSLLSVGVNNFYSADIYSGVSGPSSIGPSTTLALPSSGSGDNFGVSFGSQLILPDLILPDGYTSGASLNATNVYSGQSFASLGVTPGTYTWSWGIRSNVDTLELRVGVPETSTFVLTAIGVLGFALCLGRRALARQNS